MVNIIDLVTPLQLAHEREAAWALFWMRLKAQMWVRL